MHKLIEENLSSWENFLSGDVHYFWSEDITTNISEPSLQSFMATNAAFNDMRSLRQDLKYLIDSLNEDITRDVRRLVPDICYVRRLIYNQLNLFFAHENNQMAIIQQKTSKDVKMLSVSSLYIIKLFNYYPYSYPNRLLSIELYSKFF